MSTTTKTLGAIESFRARGMDHPVMAGGQLGAGGWKVISTGNDSIDGILFFVDNYGGAWVQPSDLETLQAANLPRQNPNYEWSFDSLHGDSFRCE